ncbi:hypothetical protein N0V90_002260 [Kalmusia sp. IMI 367209]|nr:hypothetical protein N0V90_002260 [Kalmusia sp. IMI 367209]
MANNGIRRKDTTKGPPLRILSLDGGGVRGYSMLIILQELMHRTFVEMEGRAPKRHEIPKPCDHFDLIGGTGTGGLIAIMLGRLRMDLETCKNVYVRMTKRVFETDKTFAGIPYRHTFFKASKLEEAIKECVREHTVYDDEGNDSEDAMSSSVDLRTPMTPGSAYPNRVHRSPSTASRYSQIGMTPVNPRIAALKWGNPNARLYDNREERTKTAITAVYKGSRSTDTGQILDEAVRNEWPGRDVGVFISIGTGKRPEGTPQEAREWWEGFAGGIGDFAEARRTLIRKIEDCEKTHQSMKDILPTRQVNPEHYYRLNVNVGVGEFGMNEWNRLSDISSSTRIYLAEKGVQSMTFESAGKLARVYTAKLRWERAEKGLPPRVVPDASPLAIELPAEEVTPNYYSSKHEPFTLLHPAYRGPSDNDKYAVVSSDEYPQPVSSDLAPRHSGELVDPNRRSGEQFTVGSAHNSPQLSFEEPYPHSPPPRPPKTPFDEGAKPTNLTGPPTLPPPTSSLPRPPPGAPLPYPDTDGPPPVNMSRKPEFKR